MIKILLEIHPDAVRVETYTFFLPLHHCVFFNNPNLTENNTLEHWHLIIWAYLGAINEEIIPSFGLPSDF
jgi:hypothetical protein